MGRDQSARQALRVGIICYFIDPMLDPLETSELLAFTKAVEAKSLSRAAAELRTPRATISRRLARLEERLGVRLLRRTTRSLALTDAGDAFYRHARIVLDALDVAEASVGKGDSGVRGSLRIATPPLLDASFHALLCEFAKQYPDVALHVNASARRVDLRREGYDVALRVSADLEPGLMAVTLARASVVAVASPDYLATHGKPKTGRDLRHHTCLLALGPAELPESYWPRAGGGKISVKGSFVANDILLLLEATLRGLGIAVLPTLLIAPLLESGALVQVMPSVIHAESRVCVVYPEKEFLPPQVRAFIDAVVEWASARGRSFGVPRAARKLGAAARSGDSRK